MFTLLLAFFVPHIFQHLGLLDALEYTEDGLEHENAEAVTSISNLLQLHSGCRPKNNTSESLKYSYTNFVKALRQKHKGYKVECSS